jgi:methyltransferase-like protein 23
MTVPTTLETSTGDVQLQECRVQVGGREWAVLHTGALVTYDQEASFLSEKAGRIPYGVALWPSALALAHEIATRPEAFRGRRVLELGAGIGLPGIVAAALGGRVLQTDRNDGALAVCRLNGERNRAAGIEYRLADWADWTDPTKYDWLIGADVLYAEDGHAHLRRIFDTSLAPGGRVLAADPFRGPSLRFLESLQAAGWAVSFTKWTVGEAAETRPVGVFELTPPDHRG